jgi:hypothetical protein
MTDRPILYSAPMIRALLAGTKTQTRRLCKWTPALLPDGKILSNEVVQSGDRLWVREAWRTFVSLDSTPPRDLLQPGRGAGILYEADDGGLAITAVGERSMGERDDRRAFGKLRPGMFMPRWASRLTQIVTDVRVQRLQDISEEDALAEGIERQDPTAEDFEWAKVYAEEEGITEADFDMGPVWLAPGTRQGFGPRRDSPKWGATPTFAYRLLWEHINGPGSWDANPWVAAYTLETHRCNIDAMPAGDGDR